MARGGKREGAGRKPNSNRYREATKPVRVPLSLIHTVSKLLNDKADRSVSTLLKVGADIQTIYKHRSNTPFYAPLYNSRVSAGTPFVADDHIEKSIDLNKELVKHPSATFFVRVCGDSMIHAGIFDGDTLVVDRSLSVYNRAIVIAVLNGELTVKRFIKSDTHQIILQPENSNYQPIVVDEGMDFQVWGVVTNVIRALV